MAQIVAIDIGGTHARFAVAELAGKRVRRLGEASTLATGEHAGLEEAFETFRDRCGGVLPRAAAIAFAGPVGGDALHLTNSPWSIRPADLPLALGLDRLTIVNDFGAVAHAVAQLDADHFRTLCGPAGPTLPSGVISVVGPGTGLGVALLLRRAGSYEIIETEGGHIDFAPLDSLEDSMLTALRERYGRVSVERIVGGAGLGNIYAVLAATERKPPWQGDHKALWTAALDGSDDLAVAALQAYCRCLGAVVGDLALAHGADGAVVAGGLGLRLAEHLPGSGFCARFIAKGRFGAHMARVPVKLLTHPQPGLFGAAAAFALEHC